MLTRFFGFLFGFGLTVIGLVFIISYLNLLSVGYNFKEYVNFIVRRIECWNAIFGFIIMIICIFKGGKHELYI